MRLIRRLCLRKGDSAVAPQGVLRLNWRELLFEEAGRVNTNTNDRVCQCNESHLDVR
jgi:hypothetical protein